MSDHVQREWTLPDAPNVLTCPECGSPKVTGDPEGACACPNGHAFWDTQAPEWLILREAQRLQVCLADAEARAERVAGELERLANMNIWVGRSRPHDSAVRLRSLAAQLRGEESK